MRPKSCSFTCICLFIFFYKVIWIKYRIGKLSKQRRKQNKTAQFGGKPWTPVVFAEMSFRRIASNRFWEAYLSFIIDIHNCRSDCGKQIMLMFVVLGIVGLCCGRRTGVIRWSMAREYSGRQNVTSAAGGLNVALATRTHLIIKVRVQGKLFIRFQIEKKKTKIKARSFHSSKIRLPLANTADDVGAL